MKPVSTSLYKFIFKIPMSIFDDFLHPNIPKFLFQAIKLYFIYIDKFSALKGFQDLISQY